MTVGSGEFFAGMGFASAQLQVSSEAEEAKKLLVREMWLPQTDLDSTLCRSE